jgi:hypothetical protein
MKKAGARAPGLFDYACLFVAAVYARAVSGNGGVMLVAAQQAYDRAEAKKRGNAQAQHGQKFFAGHLFLHKRRQLFVHIFYLFLYWNVLPGSVGQDAFACQVSGLGCWSVAGGFNGRMGARRGAKSTYRRCDGVRALAGCAAAGSAGKGAVL